MAYIPRLQSSGYNWIGDGRIVYSTGYVPNTPFGDNSALQQLYAPYKDAQLQRRAQQAAQSASKQTGRTGHVTVYDAAKRQYVSATPQEAGLIRNSNLELQAQRRAAQTKQLGTGHVTVYDAAKRQYVSATPQEADLIRNSNRELQAQRRAAQVKPLGTGNVTVFDASKGQYVSATPAEAKLITKSNKRISAIEGLNERITSHMENTSYYGGKTVKSGGEFISVSADQVKAQAQRRTAQGAKELATGNVTVYDALKRQYVSATPTEAKLIKEANNKLIFGNGTPNVPDIIRGASGTGTQGASNLPVLVRGSGASGGIQELEVIGQTVNEAPKQGGFWSKFKGGISSLFGKAKSALSSGWTKFKAFAKTPKGKWGLAIAAVVIAGTALFGYVANRFSAKNRPTPTNGPDKIFMPKIEDEVKETDEEKETEETKETEKTEKKDKKTEPAKVTPAPVDEDEDIDDVDETDEVKPADDEDEDVDDVDETEEAKKVKQADKKDEDEDVDDVDETDEVKPADNADKTDETKKADESKKAEEADKVKDEDEDVDDED